MTTDTPATVTTSPDRFARIITRIVATQPGDRSVLRHSLGSAPGQVPPGVHRIVAPHLSDTASPATERAYYTVAALIAAQPRAARDTQPAGPAAPGPDGTGPPTRRNLGASLARADHTDHADHADCVGTGGRFEARLHLLARQDLTGIHRQLPRLIHQLRADQVPVDWGQLIRDLIRWGGPGRRDVAAGWVTSYYRTQARLTGTRPGETEPTDTKEQP